jgi:hypothetical protein
MEIDPMRKRDLTLGYTPEFVQRWDILKCTGIINGT